MTIPSPDSVPRELYIIVNARGKIVADLGNGDPLTRVEAEEGAAHLDHSEPVFLAPHRVLTYAVMPQDV